MVHIILFLNFDERAIFVQSLDVELKEIVSALVGAVGYDSINPEQLDSITLSFLR